MRGYSVSAFLLLMLSAGVAKAACPVLSPTKSRSIERFVAAKYRLTNSGVLLTDTELVKNSCIRELTFTITKSQKNFLLYLSSDQRYLMTKLMDLSVDPVVAMDQEDQARDAQLLASPTPAVRGPAGAKIRLVEFSDFQCPFCKQFDSLLRGVGIEHMRDVQVEFRQMPIARHTWAKQAAMLATCVAVLGKDDFWRLGEYLFAHQETLRPESVTKESLAFLRKNSAVDVRTVSACLDKGDYESTLKNDERLAKQLRVVATPTVFVNGRRVSPLRSVADVESALSAAREATTRAKEAASVARRAP